MALVRREAGKRGGVRKELGAGVCKRVECPNEMGGPASMNSDDEIWRSHFLFLCGAGPFVA